MSWKWTSERTTIHCTHSLHSWKKLLPILATVASRMGDAPNMIKSAVMLEMKNIKLAIYSFQDLLSGLAQLISIGLV